jgi:hypothetical protein
MLYVIGTETSFITQGISRAKSASITSRHYKQSPMALPYPERCRLEASPIHFCERSLHQPTDIGLRMGNSLVKLGRDLDKFWSPSARAIVLPIGNWLE